MAVSNFRPTTGPAQDLGPPDRLILGFAPELVGAPLPDNAVSATQVVQKGGRTYYQWCVCPHPCSANVH